MATREVVCLNEATPQLEAPQSGDTYYLVRDVVCATGILSSEVVDGASADCWVFDTPALSASGADIAVFKNNGTSKFKIDKDGKILTGDAAGNAFWVYSGDGATQLMYLRDVGNSSPVEIGESASTATSTNSPVAIGQGSYVNASGCVAIGQSASGQGVSGVALGRQSRCVGSGSVSIGSNSDAILDNATAVGIQANALKVKSTALGAYSEANHYGGFALAGEAFVTNRAGENQYLVWQPAATTTDATPAPLYMDEDGASERMNIEVGDAYAFTAHIMGVQSDGTDASYFIRQGIIANNAGTTALIGSIQTIGTDIESSASTEVAITADNTNDALDITVTGPAVSPLETWRWSANVHVKQITIGT